MVSREEAIRRITDRYASPPFPSPTVHNRAKPRLSVDFSGLSEEDMRLRDRYYMSCALELAGEAALRGEAPVGAVIVRGRDIISADFNGRESERQAMYHAECAAIYRACEALGGWRLPGCELYVTLEPCVMCAGAVMAARLPRVVFAIEDRKAGAFGGSIDVDAVGTSHHPMICRGVMEEEAARIISEFFESKRARR